ncbi:ras-related and estrogen-regulated growth inhibitor-like protein isoform X2 [Rhodnius prolixus]|uniref:ras-related and estrogen-regulated growth inhibitor-like protein isoform X2 n=1 Tax=Rhodnius prolixus TaxID=13249 RepID=UPI003D187969
MQLLLKVNAITVKYLTRRYIGEYSSRVDFLYKKYEWINGVPTQLEILDTCKYPDRLSKEILRWADAFLLVFSVVDSSSLFLAERLLDSMDRNRRPTLLMANKCDLEHARAVSSRSGQELAVKHGCLYLEVSAAGNTQESRPTPAFLALAGMCLLQELQQSSSCFSARNIWRQIVSRSEKQRLQSDIPRRLVQKSIFL